MFHPDRVQEKLDNFQKEFKWRPIEHSIAEVDDFSKKMLEVFETDQKGNIFQKRGLSKREERFIANERAMCNPPEAPIWMGDYTFKPIGEIKIGDEVIGWEREQRAATKRGAASGNFERMKRATVVAVMRRISPIVKVTMESGNVIRCTPDHLWSNGATYRSEIPWINPKVGRTLRRVVDLYPNEPPDLRAAAWLGGVYDGEGHKTHITQSGVVNPEVYAQIKKNLGVLGFEYSLRSGDDAEKTEVYAKDGVKMHRRPDLFTVKGGLCGMARFGAWCKPAKMRSVDGVVLKNLSAKPDKIVSIEPDGEGEVVSMQTTTGNYVAWGYASKNCMASCLYFLTRYYYIKARNQIMRFTFRKAQWILWQMMCELDLMGVSKMLQILKARQLGISTLAEGIATWSSNFIPGVASLIGSADGQKTQIMMGMMTLSIDQLPTWLPPTQTRAKMASDRGIMEFSRIGSLIMVQPGSIRGGMGQGATPTFVHLSEVSQYTDPVTQLDEGLFKALHEGPELVVMLESTGDSTHRSSWWWKEQWVANRDNYWQGGAKFLPVFLPWHCAPDLYPGEQWLKKFPVPADFSPNEDTVAHINRATAYVRSTPMLSKVLGEQWEMPREQQWFWQFNHEDHKRRRVEKSWYRQMPCDDYEALLGENEKVVGQSSMDTIRESIVPLDKTPVYMLVGEEIPERREPDVERVWYSEEAPPRLHTEWTTPKGTRMEWMFVPLKPEPEMSFDPLEKFLIYETRQDGYDYSLGADTGTGVGGDRTVLTVTRHGSDAEPDYQAAEFASDSIPAQDIYIYIAALASLYSPCVIRQANGSLQTFDHPKICIEMKRKFGDLPYHLTKQLGFKRWHEWGNGFDRKTFKEKGLGKHARIGWFTNEWSRPLLLAAFQGALENKWYVVRSKWLADELEGLEQKLTDSGKTRVDHGSGEHDDRVFGGAMSYFTLHQSDVLAERSKKRYELPLETDIVIEYGPVRTEIIIPGSAWWDRQQSRQRKPVAFQ
jgi:hypothetical protein